MNTNSNSYTIIYAAIMVVIVAFLLAFVSSSLKETQYKNVEQDTKKQILSAINVTDVKEAEAEFAKYEGKDMLMQADGTLAPYTDAFQVSYKGEIAEKRFHVFECKVDGATKYILPIYGAGLWGPIWGYVALNDDKDTVYGVYFSHAGETPGLGAEIENPSFQSQFVGKHLFVDGEMKPVAVMKVGQKPLNGAEYVDAVSGGTITSKGVQDMIENSLLPYNAFLNSIVK